MTKEQLIKAKAKVQEYLYNLYEEKRIIEGLISEGKKAKDDLKKRIRE